jgi:hypothetical protein
MEYTYSISRPVFSVLEIQNQVRFINARRIAAEQAVTRSTYGPQISAASRAGTQWVELKPAINAAASQLDVLISRVRSLRDKVSTLLTINNSAATANSTDLAQDVILFNAALRDLNGLANFTTQNPNLVGTDYDVNIAYFSNPDLDVTRVVHRDLSSGYTLTESGGNYWAKDDISTDLVLLQYDSDGVETGKSVVVNLELRLDSLSGSTIAFTIHAGTDSEESFTGASLATNGLGILDAWGYDGLATSDGRALAETTLRSALKTLDGNLASLNSALAQARFDFGIAEVNAEGSGSKISAVNQRQLLALQEHTDNAGNADLALAVAINRNIALRNGYLNLLGISSLGNAVNVLT